MKEWEVTVDLGTGQFGPFRARYQAGYNVQAETAQEAATLGLLRAEEAGHTPAVPHRVTTQQRHRFDITLRGRTDKRRRETYRIRATSEREAIKFLAYRTAPVRFAGWFSPEKRDAIVKIERV